MRRCSQSDCRRAGQLLPESEFSGESLYCKECMRKYQRNRQNKTQKHRDDAKAYYQAHREEILRKTKERNARKREEKNL